MLGSAAMTSYHLLFGLTRFFKRCEEYFLCKYQPPDGVNSVGQHIELEINIYLQRFPPQQRHIRRLVFDYLLKRECCITGKETFSNWLDPFPCLAIKYCSRMT